MDKNQLVENIFEKKSFLCVGLDTDTQKIPEHLKSLEDPIFEFNKQIIDATKDFTVAYKPNIAFYESMGASGWESLRKTVEYIPKNIFTIADAKRGDIGNTSKLYARAFFENLDFDSITVTPYMGHDSVLPFLEYQEKWVVLLALTSNGGALDFQELELSDHTKLFEKVLKKSRGWGNPENLMYVVGATRVERLEEIRRIVPDNFLLVPGVGAQGGSLEQVCKYGFNKEIGLLVNASRSIIYAGNDENFAYRAGEAAKELALQMSSLMERLL